MERSADAAVEWRIQPLLVRTPQFVIGLAATLALSTLVAWIEGEIIAGAIAALILFVALINAFLPSSYRVDADGLLIDHPLRRRRIRWSSMRQVSLDAAGALVSYEDGKRRDVSITFPRERSRVEAIAAALRAHSGAGEAAGAGTRAREGAGEGSRESFAIVDKRPVARAWRPQ